MATETGERKTYEGWLMAGRQVMRGARRGPDGKFGIDQTKPKTASRRPNQCAQCGCRLNYGKFCGKCEYGS